MPTVLCTVTGAPGTFPSVPERESTQVRSTEGSEKNEKATLSPNWSESYPPNLEPPRGLGGHRVGETWDSPSQSLHVRQTGHLQRVVTVEVWACSPALLPDTLSHCGMAAPPDEAFPAVSFQCTCHKEISIVRISVGLHPPAFLWHS